MKRFHANFHLFRLTYLVLCVGVGIAGSSVLAASSNPSLLKAKQEAEAKGYIFVSSHDEVVSRAKQEGKLRAVVSLTENPLKNMLAAFNKKYPFIETRGESVPNREVYVRLLQELKAGLTKGVDVNDPISDYYNEYLPYQKKLDVFGMAEQKILQIPLQMVDPINRNIVVIGSSLLESPQQERSTTGGNRVYTWKCFRIRYSET